MSSNRQLYGKIVNEMILIGTEERNRDRETERQRQGETDKNENNRERKEDRKAEEKNKREEQDMERENCTRKVIMRKNELYLKKRNIIPS